MSARRSASRRANTTYVQICARIAVAARPVAYPNATMIATFLSEAPRCRAAAAVTMKAAR